MWANKSICSYSDFNLAYVAEFQYKAGYAKKKKTVGMETLDTHFLLYGRNIIPPHICYSTIVQMIDFLVNCISAPYIIKICDFVAL
jgi:hypothetical protein